MNRKITLEQLEKFIDMTQLPEYVNYELGMDKIGEDVIVGGSSVNTIVNRVFTYRFSSNDLEDLIRVFKNLNMGSMNFGKIYNCMNEIRSISREMRTNKSYPLEAILYASKTINSLLNNNEILIDELGDLLKEIYESSPNEYKTAVEHILLNWRWVPQLNLIINACGKIKDEELLELIYTTITNEKRVEAFKAFVNSGLYSSIPNIMKCMATVEYNDMTSNKMCKYFNQYYPINFPGEGINCVREYISTPHLSNRAKKELNKILPMNTIENATVMTLGDIINLCKNRKIDNFDEYIKQGELRKKIYIGLRWIPKEKDIIAKSESIILNGLTNFKNNSNYIGEALITLAILNSDKTETIIRKQLASRACVEYCYVALILMGNSFYEDKLLEEIFQNQNLMAINLLKHCKNKIEDPILNKLSQYLESNDKIKIINGLRVLGELINNNVLVGKERLMLILKQFIERNSGFGDINIKGQLIKTIELIFNDKTKDKLIPILFSIRENKLYSIVEKAKVTSLLLSVGAEVPK